MALGQSHQFCKNIGEYQANALGAKNAYPANAGILEKPKSGRVMNDDHSCSLKRQPPELRVELRPDCSPLEYLTEARG